jgi:hypothetical protein
MTNEMDIETKIRPIQRLREVATILNSLEGTVPLVSISARASQYATRRVRELRLEIPLRQKPPIARGLSNCLNQLSVGLLRRGEWGIRTPLPLTYIEEHRATYTSKNLDNGKSAAAQADIKKHTTTSLQAQDFAQRPWTAGYISEFTKTIQDAHALLVNETISSCTRSTPITRAFGPSTHIQGA